MGFYALSRPAQCSGIAGGGESRLSLEPPGSDQFRTGCGADAEGALEHGRAGDVSLIAGAAVFAKVNAIGGVCAVSVFERHLKWRQMCCEC